MIWKCLAKCPNSLDSIPTHDIEMTAKIESDITPYNVNTYEKSYPG